MTVVQDAQDQKPWRTEHRWQHSVLTLRRGRLFPSRGMEQWLGGLRPGLACSSMQPTQGFVAEMSFGLGTHGFHVIADAITIMFW